ncbi:hypothetical protein GCWU000341_00272 [Oribacterium sp. oral taxon 078 str. F0262]|nr:hypothetical protein GCWU000341_00272 [Oribacterium sp. oral taxon 078 str. F0262]
MRQMNMSNRFNRPLLLYTAGSPTRNRRAFCCLWLIPCNAGKSTLLLKQKEEREERTALSESALMMIGGEYGVQFQPF